MKPSYFILYCETLKDNFDLDKPTYQEVCIVYANTITLLT